MIKVHQCFKPPADQQWISCSGGPVFWGSMFGEFADWSAVAKDIGTPHESAHPGLRPIQFSFDDWIQLNRGAFCLDVRTLTFLPTNGFSIKPPKGKLLAGEQKATE